MMTGYVDYGAGAPRWYLAISHDLRLDAPAYRQLHGMRVRLVAAIDTIVAKSPKAIVTTELWCASVRAVADSSLREGTGSLMAKRVRQRIALRAV
jgi:hypothetical protein